MISEQLVSNNSARRIVKVYWIFGFLIVFIPLILVALSFFLNRQTKASPANQSPVKQESVQQNTNSAPSISPASGGDLGYIMIVASPRATMVLFDDKNQKIAESYLEQGIADPVTHERQPQITTLYAAKPVAGNYQLKVSGIKNSDVIKVYFYNKEGEVEISEKTINSDTTLNLHYDKSQINNSKIL